MPPWPSRILPSTSSPSSHSNQVTASPSTHRNPNETDRSAFFAIDYNVPVLLPTAPTATMTTAERTRRQSHARSNSQPFPSLMNGSLLRKPEKKIINREFAADLEDDTTGLNQSRNPGDDMVNGKCMTCNSTCRWPKNVQVFRCMICLTVNDLEPHPVSARTERHNDVDDDLHPPPPPPKDGSPEHPLPGMETTSSQDYSVVTFYI